MERTVRLSSDSTSSKVNEKFYYNTISKLSKDKIVICIYTYEKERTR